MQTFFGSVKKPAYAEATARQSQRFVARNHRADVSHSLEVNGGAVFFKSWIDIVDGEELLEFCPRAAAYCWLHGSAERSGRVK